MLRWNPKPARLSPDKLFARFFIVCATNLFAKVAKEFFIEPGKAQDLPGLAGAPVYEPTVIERGEHI